MDIFKSVYIYIIFLLETTVIIICADKVTNFCELRRKLSTIPMGTFNFISKISLIKIVIQKKTNYKRATISIPTESL